MTITSNGWTTLKTAQPKHVSFLTALRHVVEARGGMAEIAEKAGLSRESLYRALSPKGNPTLRTLRQVVHATGMTFASLT